MNLVYIPLAGLLLPEIVARSPSMYAICIPIGICAAVWILATRWRTAGTSFDHQMPR